MRYSEERREGVLKKLLPPHNQSVAAVADSEGISPATLYKWRQAARETGRLLPSQAADGPEDWRSTDKFNAVLETAALSEAELAEYCRRRGLYPEQIRRWRASCEQANGRERWQDQEHRATLKIERRSNAKKNSSWRVSSNVKTPPLRKLRHC